MSSLLATLVVLILTASCGKLESQRETTFIVPTSYSNSPIGLVKQKDICEKESGNSLFDQHLFVRGDLTTEINRDFSDLFPAKTLARNEAISRITFGEKTEISFSISGVELQELKKPEDFFICPEQQSYIRGSIESAGLNASRFIYDTFKAVSEAMPDLSISPVEVSLSPLLIRSMVEKMNDGSLRKKSAYLTDNAFYSPTASSITILPHSRELREQGFELNFWEIPMVASHEYGHHVFQLLYKPVLTDPMQGCFGPTYQVRSQIKGISNRSVSIEDVVNAYNEGFADLVSFYTLAPEIRGVKNVPCLRVTRDVSSPVLYDGNPKSFNQYTLQSFFYSQQKKEATCDDPGYQDVHTFGAIFAHNADRFLSEFTNSRAKKLATLAEWVKFLRTERKKYYLASAKTYFKGTFSDFLRMSAKKFGANLDGRLCRNIEKMYPGLGLTECEIKKDL